MIITSLMVAQLLTGPSVFRFDGGTVHDLARKLDDGTGVVVSVNSNSRAKIKAFEFKYDDQKDFDRLLAVKSGLRRLGPGAYAATGYPLHVMDLPSVRPDRSGKMEQVFVWNSKWPLKEVDEKWVLNNDKDEPYRLGLFPEGLGGKSLKMPPFFERLEVIVTSGTYAPKSLATKIATSLGGKLKDREGIFEVTPNMMEVRRRFKGTFNEKLSSLQPNDIKTQYDFASLEYSREIFDIAPDRAIEALLKNEASDDFTIPTSSYLQTAIRKRALAYSKLTDRGSMPQGGPLQPSNFLESADWERPTRAWLRPWPLCAGLVVWVKGQNQSMGL